MLLMSEFAPLKLERALSVDPTEIFNVERCLSCTPRWLVFLERMGTSATCHQATDFFCRAVSRLVASLEIFMLETDFRSVRRSVRDHQSLGRSRVLGGAAWVET